jgi:hypothetical protein
MESHYHEERIAFSSFVSLKVNFKKLLFLNFFFAIKKLVNKKIFLSLEKIWFSYHKNIYFFNFKWKIVFKSCEKFRNVILFTNYIKFDSQTFNCYIFCFESFFSSILSIEI